MASCDVSLEHIHIYFDRLTDVLWFVGATKIQDVIWNFDETAFSYDHRVPKILCHKEQEAYARTTKLDLYHGMQCSWRDCPPSSPWIQVSLMI